MLIDLTLTCMFVGWIAWWFVSRIWQRGDGLDVYEDFDGKQR